MPWPAMEIEETYVFIRSKNQQQQKKIFLQYQRIVTNIKSKQNVYSNHMLNTKKISEIN